MMHEKSLDCESPEALYQSVPVVAPSVTSIIQVVDAENQLYRLDSEETLDSLPEWDWYQIFNMCGATLPPKPPTKRELKQLRGLMTLSA